MKLILISIIFLTSLDQLKSLTRFSKHFLQNQTISFISADNTGQIHIYNSSHKEISSFLAHSNDISRFLLMKNNTLLITASLDSTIKTWSLPNFTLIKTYADHKESVLALTNKDENTMASGGADEMLKIWQLNTSVTLRTINISDWINSLVAIGNDLLANGNTGIKDSSLYIWNMKTGELVHTLKGHTQGISDLILINKGTLASASFDMTIILWNLEKWNIIQTLHGHTSSILALKFIQFYGILVSSSADSTLKLWSVTETSLIRTLEGHKGRIFSFDLYNDNEQIVSAGFDDQTLKFWNVSSGKLLNTSNVNYFISPVLVL